MALEINQAVGLRQAGVRQTEAHRCHKSFMKPVLGKHSSADQHREHGRSTNAEQDRSLVEDHLFREIITLQD